MRVNEADGTKLEQLLAEVRDNQREALALQREHLAVVQKQYERAERINERAERIQAKSAQLVGAARSALAIVLPIIIALVAYLTWLLFR
jgi:uncharacterized membrane protein (DUF106 family)